MNIIYLFFIMLILILYKIFLIKIFMNSFYFFILKENKYYKNKNL